jgi:hypothetical protein
MKYFNNRSTSLVNQHTEQKKITTTPLKHHIEASDPTSSGLNKSGILEKNILNEQSTVTES